MFDCQARDMWKKEKFFVSGKHASLFWWGVCYWEEKFYRTGLLIKILRTNLRDWGMFITSLKALLEQKKFYMTGFVVFLVFYQQILD
jgi:hypothetical protein